jgi:hypothetical protein
VKVCNDSAKPPTWSCHPPQLIACTGQVSIAFWQVHVWHLSGPITWDFSFTISNTRGHTSAQLPQPIQLSSSTTGTFAIEAPSLSLFQSAIALMSAIHDIFQFFGNPASRFFPKNIPRR